MNFHELLRRRDTLLRQAHLANVAFAYQWLGDLTARLARAGLRGRVRLHGGDPAGPHPWPRLEALEGSQAVLEEHFLDEDVIDLADILAFMHGRTLEELEFRIEELGPQFLPRLRRELAAGASGAESAAGSPGGGP